jgi:hypothetical protein
LLGPSPEELDYDVRKEVDVRPRRPTVHGKAKQPFVEADRCDYPVEIAQRRDTSVAIFFPWLSRRRTIFGQSRSSRASRHVRGTWPFL